MTFYGHKTAFVAIMLSFGLFIWAWKCYMVDSIRSNIPNNTLLIGDFAMKSNFNSITLSVLIGFILPLLIILATKFFLIKKYKKEKTKKLN